MPDENKFQALRDAGFRIIPSCATCVHWERGNRGWGTCYGITYQHQKHSGRKSMGTPFNGRCSRYELNMDPLDSEAQSYAAFYDESDP